MCVAAGIWPGRSYCAKNDFHTHAGGKLWKLTTLFIMAIITSQFLTAPVQLLNDKKILSGCEQRALYCCR